MIPKLNDICQCCCGNERQPLLQLFDDKCFKITDGTSTEGSFCLDDFAFPADGYQCFSLTADPAGGEITLFDNQTEGLSPSAVLESEKLYARGIMIKIAYPINDDNGEEILITNKNVTIALQNTDDYSESQFPLHNFFSIFTNPKSNQTSDLINRIKIINPNLEYSVKVAALVIFGKAE